MGLALLNAFVAGLLVSSAIDSILSKQRAMAWSCGLLGAANAAFAVLALVAQ